jgi:hypothetical protein
MLLVAAEYLVGIAAGYAIIRYIVLPTIRKPDSTGGTISPKPDDGSPPTP